MSVLHKKMFAKLLATTATCGYVNQHEKKATGSKHAVRHRHWSPYVLAGVA
jgi:hypothetical protein